MIFRFPVESVIIAVPLTDLPMRYLIIGLLAISFVLLLGNFSRASAPKEKYKKGFYVKDSIVVEGYIYYSYLDYKRFRFKKEVGGKKQVITAKDCGGFVVEGRIFKRLDKVLLKFGIREVFVKSLFGELMEEGPLTLYKVYSQAGSTNGVTGTGMGSVGTFNHTVNQIIVYILEKDQNKVYIQVRNGKKAFKKALEPLIGDRENLLRGIDEGVYDSGNIAELVRDYNKTGVTPLK
jgi:hypothetical protein